MKNVDKIMTALEQAFPGHKIEISKNYNAKIGCVFVDDIYCGAFEDGFLYKDFDNPEIEIKVKAPIKDFINFIDYTYKNEKTSVVSHAIEKGVREWREESQRNS